MKITTLCILSVAAEIILIALPCRGGNEKAFTATETVCYSCICPTCDQGTITAVPGGNLQLRDRDTIYFYSASDSRAAGYIRVRLSSNTDSAFNGTLWGSFYSCDASGNRVSDGWEGTWNAQLFGAFPSNWINRLTAYGTGTYNGLRMESTTVYGDSLTGIMVGVIQDQRK